MSYSVLPEAPKSLSGSAAFAWGSIARTLAQRRTLTDLDLLAIEGAANAWGRWKDLEDKIQEVTKGNILAGEVTKAADGSLKESGMRTAARLAFELYKELVTDLGIPSEGPGEFDLFGYPDRPGRGQKGRPPFRPTLRDRNRVRMLLAMGWSNARIASALEITPPTLAKHFKVELKQREEMRDRLEARRLELAMESASSGNISGLRELGKLIDKNDAVVADQQLREQAAAEPKPERLGKKEISEKLAADADSELMSRLRADANEGRPN